MRNKRLLLCVLILAVVCSIGLYANGTSSEEDTGEKVLTYAVQTEPNTLDAQKANDGSSLNTLYYLGEGLVRNIDGAIVAGVAEEWEVSDDGLTYTFHLRDSKWSDGVAVTAKDFEYTFLRLFTPETGATYASHYYAIVGAQDFNSGQSTDASTIGVKAVDDKTFVITLSYPVSYFLQYLSLPCVNPVREDVIKEYGEAFGADAEKLVTNGPFTLVNWERTATLTSVKNENYWNAEKVMLEEINYLVIPDANTQAGLYDTGEVDFIPALADAYLNTYDEAQIYHNGTTQFIQFNLRGMSADTKKFMDNKNFRLALNYAIDREGMITALQTGIDPIGRLIPPGIQGLEDDFTKENAVTLVPAKGDAAKAKEYLAAAMKELNTTVEEIPALTYLCFEMSSRKLIAEAMVDMWRQTLGVKVDIKTLPIPQTIQAGFAGEFDIYYQSMPVMTDPSTFLGYFQTGNSINWNGYSNPEYDALLTGAATILDVAERNANLVECERILLDNAINVPVGAPMIKYVYRQDKFTGITCIAAEGGQLQFIYADTVK